jgi:predicted phosphodiesterase
MRTLYIGDIHAPVTHPGYLKFNEHLADKHQVKRVCLIGDVLDHHAISFHASNPACPGPNDEYELSLACIARWHDAFPEADVCVGNHDARTYRLAETHGIGPQYLRDYADIWETPGWTWRDEFQHEGVLALHGTGRGGEHPAYNAMKRNHQSVVLGHTHHAGGVKWSAHRGGRLFGMDTGCGVDVEAAAMAYGKNFDRKPLLGSGVVIDGVPYHEPMPCSRGEKFHRSRMPKNPRRKRKP